MPRLWKVLLLLEATVNFFAGVYMIFLPVDALRPFLKPDFFGYSYLHSLPYAL